MQARPRKATLRTLTRDGRSVAIAAATLVAGGAALACGLSTSGAGDVPDDGGEGSEAGAAETSPTDSASSAGDAAFDVADGSASGDAASAVDAKPDVCVAFDAGLGPLALSAFALKGNAVFNENNDGILTLTNSNTSERGAAWYPSQVPVVGGYDLRWSLREGPGNTAGDGVAFAVIQASAMPGVGDNGDGIGLRNVAGDGSAISGYAVVVDMYKSANDPTDLGPTTLKIVAMPEFRVVAGAALLVALNDGNVYAVDVSWRAPSTLTATLHGPGGVTTSVSSHDPALTTTAPAYVGFTGATGGASDSHNEIASAAFFLTCN